MEDWRNEGIGDAYPRHIPVPRRTFKLAITIRHTYFTYLVVCELDKQTLSLASNVFQRCSREACGEVEQGSPSHSLDHRIEQREQIRCQRRRA